MEIVNLSMGNSSGDWTMIVNGIEWVNTLQLVT